MPSSYSPNLRVELQATGENRSTWGLKANGDFSLIENAICGAVTIAMADADMTLTTNNGSTDQARMAILIFTGTLTADRTITMPPVSKAYIVANFTSGGKNLAFKTSSIGAGSYIVANTISQTIWTDGTNTFASIPNINKSYVGLGNVDNTSDANKPVSTPQAAAIAQAGSPVGSIITMAAANPPANHLKLQGALLSRTTYPQLWAHALASGNITASDALWTSNTSWGMWSPGDGTTTFRTPDFRGFELRGFDDGRGVDSGRTLGSLQAQSVQSHNHAITDPGHIHGISDPGHAHSIADSGHAHVINGLGDQYNGTSDTGGRPQAQRTGAIATDTRGTGIGIYAAGTGIGIANHTTGITINNTGGTETRSANLAVSYFVKYQ